MVHQLNPFYFPLSPPYTLSTTSFEFQWRICKSKYFCLVQQFPLSLQCTKNSLPIFSNSCQSLADFHKLGGFYPILWSNNPNIIHCMKSLGIELHLQKSNSAPRIALWQMNKFVEIIHKSSDFGVSMCKLQASNFRERASFETFSCLQLFLHWIWRTF